MVWGSVYPQPINCIKCLVKNPKILLTFIGHSISAATASIPSKYQTIVIGNADRKGFLTKSRRFNYDASIVSI